VRKLALLETVTSSDADRAAFEDRLHVLFDQALLAEGGSLTDPAAYVQRVNRLLA
jgi:molecular chaperone HtpG